MEKIKTQDSYIFYLKHYEVINRHDKFKSLKFDFLHTV